MVTIKPFTDKKVSEDQITEIERKLGISFPIQYRQFLVKSNGGEPSPNCFPIAEVLAKGNAALLAFFFGIDMWPGSGYDIVTNINTFRKRIPRELIAIASDVGGNLICIAVTGENVGKIYFWEHEFERWFGLKPSYRNVAFVANSFDEFIEMLDVMEKYVSDTD